MKLLCIFIAFLLAFFIGQKILVKLYYFSSRRQLFDPVDDRKIHTGSIPRTGGMAFLPTQVFIFMSVILILRHFEVIYVDYFLLFQFMFLIMGLGILFITGIVDDLVGIFYKWKAAAQFIAALLLPASGLWISHLDGLLGITFLPGWIGAPLTIFVIVLIINAFNLIDGIDGLCSGLTILACTVLGTLFFRHESWLPVIFSFITIGALSPFFYYNVFGKKESEKHVPDKNKGLIESPESKWRIFMGDTGSMTLGLTVAFLVIRYTAGDSESTQQPNGNLLVAFSVVLVPILDVIRIICIRLLNRKPLFLPDNNHIHHYLLKLGFSKRMALYTILLTAFGFIVFNMCISRFVTNNHNVVILLDLIIWFGGLWLLGKIRRTRPPIEAQVSIEKEQNED